MADVALAPVVSPLATQFEPVVDLASGAVVGSDAFTLGRHDVLDEACAFARAWSDTTETRPTVWVELPFPDAGRVGEALGHARLSADQLVVQLAEPVLQRRGVHDGMLDLKDLGVHLAVRRVDPVGPTLRRLHGLPIDIFRFEAQEATPALLRQGHELGLVLHADGVDDANAALRLLAWGCDFAQGSLFQAI